jgi:FdrA protein
VSEKVVAALGRSSKRSVVHFVGAGSKAGSGPDHAASGVPHPEASGRVLFASSLADAADAACRQIGDSVSGAPPLSAGERAGGPTDALIRDLAARLRLGAKLRALFCGGTLGHEALAILLRSGIEVRSNLHKAGPHRITGTERVGGHVLLDLGDEIFTQGRPHPMIEPVLRNERLAAEMTDPEAGLLLFDVVLGYGSHPDPAGVLVQGIENARQIARGRGQSILPIASVTGTPEDPQDYHAQVRRLEEAGVAVVADNRTAAELAASLLRKIG